MCGVGSLHVQDPLLHAMEARLELGSKERWDQERQNNGDGPPVVGPNSTRGLKDGFTHAEIHDHSWRPNYPSRWIWISKLSAVEGIGYPVRKEEIRRLGYLARKVRRIGAPPPLTRSFASAAADEEMARAPDRLWKRRGGVRGLDGGG